MDQLSQYLCNHYNSYITGFKDCNILLWGRPEKEISIPRFLSVTVGVEYDPLCLEINEGLDLLNKYYQKSMQFKKIYAYGRKMASGSKLPFIIILYPTVNSFRKKEWAGSENAYPFDSVRFFMYEFRGNTYRRMVLNGKDIKDKLCELIGAEKSEVVGTSKSVNKSISDYFHYWSRNYLPPAITKLDFDGGFFNNGKDQIFVEIKRSNSPPIPKWRPYLNDKENYRLQYNFCRETGMDCWILHHDGLGCDYTDEKIISYFNVGGWEDKPKREKQFLLYCDAILQLRLGGKESLHSILKETYHMD